MKKLFEQINDFPIKHAFSTRHAGDFTVARHTGYLEENFINLSKATGIGIDNLSYSNQIHKANVAIVNEAKQYKNCDGLVTNKENTCLSIFTADCAPLLLVDIKAKVIGALHCGWKPFAQDIVKEGLSKMEKLGASPNNIIGAIGPCINKCCFEVGQEVVDAIDKILDKKFYTSSGDKYYLDLRKSVEHRLFMLGIKNVKHVDECTCCNVDKYFSYRKEGQDTGRLVHIISL